MSIEKILVAIDDSPSSRLVFEEALRLAQQENARLMLLHVLSTDARDESALTRLVPYSSHATRNELVKRYQEQRQVGERQGLALLKQLAEQAKAAGIASVQCHQPIGNPRELICYFALIWQADLIVMGRRNHSWFSEWWTGSVSKQVTHHAPCSVQVVPCQQPANSSPSTGLQPA
jgi:nucleotide-binding universal stress UspA family protein